MKPFTKYEGTIVPIMNNNIDTDQLIPKQYLKSVEKTGFGKHVFDEWRYNEDGSDNMDFNLNKPVIKIVPFLYSGLFKLKSILSDPSSLYLHSSKTCFPNPVFSILFKYCFGIN